MKDIMKIVGKDGHTRYVVDEYGHVYDVVKHVHHYDALSNLCACGALKPEPEEEK